MGGDRFRDACVRGFEGAGREANVREVIGTEWGFWGEGTKVICWDLD